VFWATAELATDIKFAATAPSGATLLFAVSGNGVARNDGLAMYFTRLQDAADMAKRQRATLDWTHFERVVTLAEKMAKPPRD
jgi:hypothetical protein